jgi:hypothetical protein
VSAFCGASSDSGHSVVNVERRALSSIVAQSERPSTETRIAEVSKRLPSRRKERGPSNSRRAIIGDA